MQTVWEDKKRHFGKPISFTKYRLTGDSLFISTGILSLREEQVKLYRIIDISLRQSFTDRIFNQGTITIHSTDPSAPTIQLSNVFEPSLVRDKISELVDYSRTRNNIRTTEFYDDSLNARNYIPDDSNNFM